MGDLSAEPSMEDILSSIKRIIAEEGDGSPAPIRSRRPARPPEPAPAIADEVEPSDDDEILELSDPVSPPKPTAPAAPYAGILRPPGRIDPVQQDRRSEPRMRWRRCHG